MVQEIPGLTPLWVIDFKDNRIKERTDGEKLSDEIQHMCQFIQDQCSHVDQQTEVCKERSIEIQKEIHHLHEVIDEFRSLIEHFYDEPPSDKPPLEDQDIA